MRNIPNAQAFVLRARLSTPISVRDPIPLEGILYDARFRRDQSTYMTPLTCLARTEGIYHASMSILVADGLVGPIFSRTSVLKRIDTRGHALTKVDLDPSRPASQRTISPTSKNRPSLYYVPVVSNVSEVMWQAYGDPEATLRMIRDVPSIGKLRTRTYGQVDEWTVEESQTDIDNVGWFASGQLLRRLPVSIVEKSLGSVPEGCLIEDVKLEPPFWDPGELVRCATPSLRQMIMPASSALDLLAA